MAVLQNTDRQDVAADMNRDPSLGTLPNMLKSDLQAAVNAVDDWVSTNAVSFNNALPAVAKNNMSAAQKAQLLMYVVSKRFSKGA